MKKHVRKGNDSGVIDHQLIRHVEKGSTFDGVYYLEQVFVKDAKNGNKYSDLTLRDKSGSAFVRFWGVLKDSKKGDFVYISANVDEYMGKQQIVAQQVVKIDEEVDLDDYVAVSDTLKEDVDKFDKYRGIVEGLCEKAGDKTCFMILEEMLKNGIVFRKFVEAPASVLPYYGRRGGLVARIVTVAQIAYKIAKPYRLSSEESVILFTASLLHQFGAIDAFEFRDCVPTETDKGILLGIGNLTLLRVNSAVKRLSFASAKAKKNEFNDETAKRLLHAIAAHSFRGYGLAPMTREAIILAEASSADSRIVEASDFIARDENKDEKFTAFDPIMKRRFYRS